MAFREYIVCGRIVISSPESTDLRTENGAVMLIHMKAQPRSTADLVKVVGTSTIPALIQQWATSKDDFALLVDPEKDPKFLGLLSRRDVIRHYTDSLQGKTG